MSNIRDITEGTLARSLASVFRQLAEKNLGAPRQRDNYPRQQRVFFSSYPPSELSLSEKRRIRRELRRNLKASVELIKNDKGTKDRG